MSKNNFKPIGRKSDIVVQEYQNEILIYDLKINKAFCLNKTSSLIWQACDGVNNVTQISNQINKQFDSTINEDFVWFALEQLKQENLIENETEFSAPFNDLSRREVIRKLGLVSLVALPIISTVIAPLAINAASGCPASNNSTNLSPVGCACVGANDCQNSCCGVAGAGRACVTLHSVPAGGTCRANCECPTGMSCPAATRICQ